MESVLHGTVYLSTLVFDSFCKLCLLGTCNFIGLLCHISMKHDLFVKENKAFNHM